MNGPELWGSPKIPPPPPGVASWRRRLPWPMRWLKKAQGLGRKRYEAEEAICRRIKAMLRPSVGRAPFRDPPDPPPASEKTSANLFLGAFRQCAPAAAGGGCAAAEAAILVLGREVGRLAGWLAGSCGRAKWNVRRCGDVAVTRNRQIGCERAQAQGHFGLGSRPVVTHWAWFLGRFSFQAHKRESLHEGS